MDVEDAYEIPGQQIPQTSSTNSLEEITRQLKVRLMIDGYRSCGHQFAKTDPLDLPLNKNLNGRLNENTIKTLTFGFNPS
jgi:2-oxoglutarate dehydrogenase complex dehydrogenase (E1) component-like enzyme